MHDTETRYQRVAREQRERKAAREATQRKSIAGGRWRSGAHRKGKPETYEDRLDDLGHSPDY